MASFNFSDNESTSAFSSRLERSPEAENSEGANRDERDPWFEFRQAIYGRQNQSQTGNDISSSARQLTESVAFHGDDPDDDETSPEGDSNPAETGQTQPSRQQTERPVQQREQQPGEANAFALSVADARQNLSLRDGVVSANVPGSAEWIRQDPRNRIMAVIQESAERGAPVQSELLTAIRGNVESLRQLPPERVYQLITTALGDRTHNALKAMMDAGVLSVILPEVAATRLPTVEQYIREHPNDQRHPDNHPPAMDEWLRAQTADGVTIPANPSEQFANYRQWLVSDRNPNRRALTLSDYHPAEMSAIGHPEGSIWAHTQMVLDQVERLIEREDRESRQAQERISTNRAQPGDELLRPLSAEQRSILRWGALLHDTGIVNSRRLGPNGELQTPREHAEVSAASARDIVSRLNLQPETARMIVDLAQRHMAMHLDPADTLREIYRTYGNDGFRLFNLLREADHLGARRQTDLQGRPRENALAEENERRQQQINGMRELFERELNTGYREVSNNPNLRFRLRLRTDEQRPENAGSAPNERTQALDDRLFRLHQEWMAQDRATNGRLSVAIGNGEIFGSVRPESIGGPPEQQRNQLLQSLQRFIGEHLRNDNNPNYSALPLELELPGNTAALNNPVMTVGLRAGYVQDRDALSVEQVIHIARDAGINLDRNRITEINLSYSHGDRGSHERALRVDLPADINPQTLHRFIGELGHRGEQHRIYLDRPSEAGDPAGERMVVFQHEPRALSVVHQAAANPDRIQTLAESLPSQDARVEFLREFREYMTEHPAAVRDMLTAIFRSGDNRALEFARDIGVLGVALPELANTRLQTPQEYRDQIDRMTEAFSRHQRDNPNDSLTYEQFCERQFHYPGVERNQNLMNFLALESSQSAEFRSLPAFEQWSRYRTWLASQAQPPTQTQQDNQAQQLQHGQGAQQSQGAENARAPRAARTIADEPPQAMSRRWHPETERSDANAVPTTGHDGHGLFSHIERVMDQNRALLAYLMPDQIAPESLPPFLRTMDPSVRAMLDQMRPALARMSQTERTRWANEILWTGALHDIGVMYARTIRNDDVSNPGHAEAGRNMVASIRERLALSASPGSPNPDRVRDLIAWHMQMHESGSNQDAAVLDRIAEYGLSPGGPSDIAWLFSHRENIPQFMQRFFAESIPALNPAPIGQETRAEAAQRVQRNSILQQDIDLSAVSQPLLFRMADVLGQGRDASVVARENVTRQLGLLEMLNSWLAQQRNDAMNRTLRAVLPARELQSLGITGERLGRTYGSLSAHLLNSDTQSLRHFLEQATDPAQQAAAREAARAILGRIEFQRLLGRRLESTGSQSAEVALDHDSTNEAANGLLEDLRAAVEAPPGSADPNVFRDPVAYNRTAPIPLERLQLALAGGNAITSEIPAGAESATRAQALLGQRNSPVQSGQTSASRTDSGGRTVLFPSQNEVAHLLEPRRIARSNSGTLLTETRSESRVPDDIRAADEQLLRLALQMERDRLQGEMNHATDPEARRGLENRLRTLQPLFEQPHTSEFSAIARELRATAGLGRNVRGTIGLFGGLAAITATALNLINRNRNGADQPRGRTGS